MEDIKKKTRFYKKAKFYIIFAVFFVLVIGSYAYFKQNGKVEYNYVEAQRLNLIQEIAVTGQVKPLEAVDLAFEISGKVEEIFAGIGDKVIAGQKLASLNNDDLTAQLKQAQAGVSSAYAKLQQYQAALEAQQVKLDELRGGTRPEEIQIAERAVDSAEDTMDDSVENLENIKNKAEVDIQEVYNGALTSLPNAVNKAKTAILTLTDIQYEHFAGYDTDSTRLADAKKIAVEILLGAPDAGRWTVNFISTLSGGVFGKVQNAVADPTHENIDKSISDTLDALQKVKNALDLVPVTAALTVTERANLTAEKNNISTEIITISGKQQLTEVQKSANKSSIASAEYEFNSAKNALAIAQDELGLKRAGYTQEQIKAQEAQVKQVQANISAQRALIAQAQANVQSYQAQIEKTMLRAPIDGIVTKMEAKVGEIVFPSSITYTRPALVTLISESNFKIEANVPEVDIAKMQISHSAKVTLDAYGDDVEFQAIITAIDPAETIVEGIPTYKVTLQFAEYDERVKSGMTANLDILTGRRDNVIAIPNRAVISKGDREFVLILKSAVKKNAFAKNTEIISDEEDLRGVADDARKEGQLLKIALHQKDLSQINEIASDVTTGLLGSDGWVEIIEGVEDGDRVVMSKEKKP